MSSSDDGVGMKSVALNEDEEEELKRIYSASSSQQQLPFLFPQAQQNSEALHRQQFGGVVVYDSCARIIGNSMLQTYYDANPPEKIDFSILFNDKEQLLRWEKLFHREPRERDFANDFDKFVFKHLPKFQPEKQFVTQNSYTINVPQQENILIFDSRFENGNLRRAIKVNNVEYNLLLENDVNTKGHTQWFYFKVIHKYPRKQRVQFNILNLAKPQSLFPLGMKPCIYSRRQHNLFGKGWFRGGDEVKYFQNDIPRKNQGANIQGANSNHNAFLYSNNGAGEGLEYFFTLSFIYEFEEEEDEVWFAHAVPYTFTDLQRNLRHILDKDQNKDQLKVNALCRTLAGSFCPLVTITNNISTYEDYADQLELNLHLPSVVKKQMHRKYQKCKKLYRQSMESKGKVRKLLKAAFTEEIKSFFSQYQEEFTKIDPRRYENFQVKFKAYIEDHYQKKAIVITSRVHPGEPQASYMLQGFIDFLLSDEAKELRENFVFRIVPMLNIDGVIYGNYRCSLLGVDLNRKWVQPNIFLHPTIFYCKQLIRQLHNERRVLMFCDLHGHSRKQNAFFYACTYKNFEHEGRIKNAQLRIIPLLCCHKNTIFKFKDCRFRIEKCKESTARVVIFREFNIMNSFTLECSFFGTEEPFEKGDSMHSPLDSHRKIRQLGIKEFMSVGAELAKVVKNYLPKEQSKLNVLSGKILEIFYDEFIKFIPPYVLKREEERMKQLNQETANNPQMNQSEIIQPPRPPPPKQVIQQSPRQQQIPPLPLNLRSGSVKKQRKSLFQGAQSVIQNHPPTTVQANLSMPDQVPQTQPNRKSKANDFNSFSQPVKKGSKPKRRATLAKKNIQNTVEDFDIKRDQVLQSESMLAYQGEKVLEKQMSQKTDTFSQMINIHPNQEELLDLEFFIKGVKELGTKKNRGGDEEEDEEGGNTDSSDSEASVKNIYVNHTQKRNLFMNANAKQELLSTKAGKKKATKKNGAQYSKGQNYEDEKLDQASQMLKSKRRITSTKNSNLMASVDGGKRITGILSNESTLDQNLKHDNLSQQDAFSQFKKLQFDKISHVRQSSSNDDAEEDNLSTNIKRKLNDTNLSRNKGNTLRTLEEEKVPMVQEQNDQSISAIYFKSYEELSNSILQERQKIIPLYENPAYHQNRLTTNGHQAQSFMIHNEITSGNSSLIQSSLLQNVNSGPSQQFKIPNLSQAYEPYEDFKSLNNSMNTAANMERSSTTNAQECDRPIFKGQRALNSNQGMQKIPMSKQGHPSSKEEGLLRYSMPLGKTKQMVGTQNKKEIRPEEIYSNRRQQYPNVNVSHPSNQAHSLKRMSFRELLESSRQTRVTVSNKGKPSNSLCKNQVPPPENQNYLLQVLKNTYQRFQQNTVGGYFNRQGSADNHEETGKRGGIDSDYVSQSPTRRFADDQETSSYLNVKGYSNKEGNNGSALSSLHGEGSQRHTVTKIAKNENQQLVKNIHRSKIQTQSSSKQSSIQNYKERIALQTSNSMVGAIIMPQNYLQPEAQVTPQHIQNKAKGLQIHMDKRQPLPAKKNEFDKSAYSVKQKSMKMTQQHTKAVLGNYDSSTSSRAIDLSLISADKSALPQNQKNYFFKNQQLPPSSAAKKTTKINQSINNLIS